MNDAPKGQLGLNGVDPLEEKEFKIRKRSGHLETFNEQRIELAIESAFKAELGLAGESALPELIRSEVEQVANAVVRKVLTGAVHGEELEVEHVQDTVEAELMEKGHHQVARR